MTSGGIERPFHLRGLDRMTLVEMLSKMSPFGTIILPHSIRSQELLSLLTHNSKIKSCTIQLIVMSCSEGINVISSCLLLAL